MNLHSLAQALAGAVASGAGVINLSLGGPAADPLLAQRVELGEKQGAIVVAAEPRVVGSMTSQSDFRVTSPWIDTDRSIGAAGVVHAPGGDVLSLVPGGHCGFSSGASLATAHASGVVALLLARHRHLSSADVKALLLGSDIESAGAGLRSINACLTSSALEAGAHCGAAEKNARSSAIAPEWPEAAANQFEGSPVSESTGMRRAAIGP